MAFIVINLLPINPTSLQCGQRLGVAGNHFFKLLTPIFWNCGNGFA